MDYLNTKIDECIEKHVIPGMVYSVISDNGIDIGSLGYKSLVPNKEKTSINTIYDIASLTKVIVIVTIISRLIDRNVINIKEKVKKYLPNFKYDDITIYDLLLHVSGLPADLKDKSIMKIDEIRSRIYSVDKEYETGSKFIYSDLGYIILGDIISTIYNKPLDVVAREEVFIPLEMNNTSYNPKDKSNCAPTEVTENRGILKGVVHDEKAYSLGGIAGNAGVFSNINDLSNYVCMVLNDGIFDGKRYLSKEIIDTWFLPLVYDEKNDLYRSFCYIIGNNDIVIEQGNNIISFNGYTGPSISIDRDNKIGIVLLTNRVHPSRDNKKISIERPKISKEIYKHLEKSKKYFK